MFGAGQLVNLCQQVRRKRDGSLPFHTSYRRTDLVRFAHMEGQWQIAPSPQYDIMISL
jgi:hypothetical protein